MIPPPDDDALRAAVEFHRAGRLAEAEAIYREVLARQPDHPEAQRLLGVLARQRGRPDLAVALIRRAIAVDPSNAEAYTNLGNALQDQGELDEAISAYREAIRRNPKHVEAHQNLGSALQTKRQLPEATASYREALRLEPENPAAHFSLGNTLQEARQFDEAIASYLRAIEARPDYLEARNNLGIALHNAGRIEEAVAAYEAVLRLDPQYAAAYNNLGNALNDLGRKEEALGAYSRALELDPNHAGASNNLGTALKSLGRLDEAITAYRRSLEIDPDFATAYNNLGNALKERDLLPEALEAYKQALRLQQGYAEAHNNLGDALRKAGRLEEAIAAFAQALRLRPEYAEAHNNLGVALGEKGLFAEALAAFRESLRIEPGSALTEFNLGNTLSNTGSYAEAVAAYHRALQLNPHYLEAWNNLGNCLKDHGRLDEAVTVYRSGLEVSSDSVEVLANLANALAILGRIDEALATCDRAIALAPKNPIFHSNRLFNLHLHPAQDAASLLREHREWNDRHAKPLRQTIQPHLNEATPERRLRIGFVSPDFRHHVVGHSLLPLYREHDQRQFEIFSYANVRHPDAITEQFRLHSKAWRDIARLDDETAAALIRADAIDILVDLAVHSSGNRLPLFARKPAPIQVTYLGYCSTTGMDAMDYRLSDPYLDPIGSDLGCYSEETIRLHETYWCYEPLGPTPLPLPCPALANGCVTFGCLNNPAKISEPAWDLWLSLLREVAKSRLVLHVPESARREAMLRQFVGCGLPPERLCFVAKQPWNQYLQTLEKIDIALDTFPFGGGITTCDALWMGVPVVTLSGQTAVSRGGRSILSNIGLSELMAETPTRYVNIAASLANDLPRLGGMRGGLRERMERSPQRDARGFARKLEALFRSVWRRWCENPSPTV